MESTSKLRVSLLIAVMAATCLAGCGALRMEGYFNSDFETQMEYVGRFVFNPNTHGKMLYDIKFPANECCVTMIMFRGDESQWPLVRAHEDEMTCHEKRDSIPGIQNSKIFFRPGREGCVLETDDNGREIVHCATDKNMFVSKYDRWFYITFMNCHYLRNVGVHVDYKIQVLNGNRTLSREFSADESSNLAVTFISAIVLSTLIILAIIQTVQLSHRRKLHTTYRIWLLSVFAQYIGVIISLVALYNFALDGYKKEASILAAHVLTSVGNVIFTVILILIGKGYTITRLTIRTIGVVKIWLFVCAYSAMFISLYILKDFADPRDVRNIYDSPVAVGLVILRFIALAWVFYGVCFTLKDFPKKRIFYSAFTLFITIWFLSEPLMILMSKYFIPLYCRAKIIYAMYLGTAIFGHVVFLCLTRPSTTNKFFPFHLRTNQVDASPFDYVIDDTESQKFEGGFYDMFMTKDERAKKNTDQGKIPTISTIVSEKETDSTTVTYVESIDLFPSSEKDDPTGPFQAAKTRGRQSIYQHIEPEEDNTSNSTQVAKTEEHQPEASHYIETKEDNTTRSLQAAKTLAPHNTYPSHEPGENTTTRSVQAAKTPTNQPTYSFLEPEEDNTTGSVQAVTIQIKQPKTNAYLELEKEIFPAQEIPSVRNPERMYPSSESGSDEDLGTITLGDISNKMAAKNRLPDVETNTYIEGWKTSTKGTNQSFPAPLHTTILAREAAMVFNNRETFPNNTKNGNQARKPASRAKDAQKLNNSAPLTPDTAVRSCTPEGPAPQQTNQIIPVVKKKKQRAQSKDECEHDHVAKDEDMVEQPPPLPPKKKKHQVPTTVEYIKEDKAMPTASHMVSKDKTTEKREKIMAMRAALRQAEAEYEMDLLLTEGAPSVDMEEEKRRRGGKMQQEKTSLEKAVSEGKSEDSEREERRRRRRAKKMLEVRQSSEVLHQEGASSAEVERDESKSSEALHQERGNLADEEKEERRRRRRAKKILEKRQSLELHHQEDAASVDINKDERRKVREALEGGKSSEALHQEGAYLADLEKQERRQRRARKILEKRQSLELQHQEDAASVNINKDERKMAWEALDGDKSSEVFHQEGADLADLEKQERRRRRARRMLEKRRSMEVHGQEGKNSAEAEREEIKKASETPEHDKSQERIRRDSVTSDDVQEERRRRRTARKMLEKRQTSDVHQEAEKEERRKKAWETPEENRLTDQLHQEDSNLVNAGREERLRRVRAKKVLGEEMSSEVLHQQGTAFTEAEKEERRRRRRLRKNNEARRMAEMEAQIV